MSIDGFNWEYWIDKFKEMKKREPKSDDELLDFAEENSPPYDDEDAKEIFG